jgi:hypothetical protein
VNIPKLKWNVHNRTNANVSIGRIVLNLRITSRALREKGS